MKNRFSAAVAVALFALPSFAFADDVAPPAAASPSPTPMSAYDRLVGEIAKLDHFLLDQNIPADKRARLTKARDDMEAQRQKLEEQQRRPSATPR